MNLSAREIGPSERQRFNAFLEQSPKGHILQSWEWGEVKATTGWVPLRLIVEEDRQIVAAISLLKRKLPGINRSIFYAPRGPVLDIGNERVFKFLLGAVRELARKHHAIFLKIDPDIPVTNTAFIEFLHSQGFRPAETEEGFEGVQPKYVFRLDLTPSLTQLFENLHSKTRYNVRLAIKKGVKIKTNCTKADLPTFYRILVETAERDRFLIRSYAYFETMWDQLVPPGYAKLFLAEYEGIPIAGTLAFIFGDKAWYIYGASSNQYRNVMPNYLLQWTMIEWAKENQCRLYDFRGVPGPVPEDHPLYGLVRFKKGFNGDYTEFVGEYDLVYAPFYYWAWNTAEPLYAQGIRKLIALRKKLRKSR
ncbi:MAG: peptidoglycan bridge formation glycyltransferase FemA/FemB family protein [Firmicutes bacterium]|nr:peptidoglycan bridge formation glycyltransferase FemA/FemB family protein [Bacillota bacterium]